MHAQFEQYKKSNEDMLRYRANHDRYRKERNIAQFMVQNLIKQVEVSSTSVGIKRQSSFIRDICRQWDYYYRVTHTWLVGVPTYEPSFNYPIPPLGYIHLDFYILPMTIDSEAQGVSSVHRGQARGVASRSRSVTVTSSHHYPGLAKL